VKKQEDVKKADKINAAHYSTGKVSASFTSTAMEPNTHHEAAIIDEDDVRHSRVKKKGYVRLQTNLGPINLEVHCEMIPKASENFIRHCQNGYYNGTVFHRSIKNFMIQGGDPTATGHGGESIYGKPFVDEFKPNLIHAGRGILSMANSGPGTNKSQFFITYRSCRHLDNKHTVFGRVVGGLDTLNAMERIECDNKDRPKEEIKIERTAVFVNPFQEIDEELEKEREADKKKEETEKQEQKRKVPVVQTVFREGIGKYISPSVITSASEGEKMPPPAKRKKVTQPGKLKDFSGW